MIFCCLSPRSRSWDEYPPIIVAILVFISSYSFSLSIASLCDFSKYVIFLVASDIIASKSPFVVATKVVMLVLIDEHNWTAFFETSFDRSIFSVAYSISCLCLVATVSVIVEIWVADSDDDDAALEYVQEVWDRDGVVGISVK